MAAYLRKSRPPVPDGQGTAILSTTTAGIGATNSTTLRGTGVVGTSLDIAGRREVLILMLLLVLILLLICTHQRWRRRGRHRCVGQHVLHHLIPHGGLDRVPGHTAPADLVGAAAALAAHPDAAEPLEGAPRCRAFLRRVLLRVDLWLVARPLPHNRRHAFQRIRRRVFARVPEGVLAAHGEG